MPDAGDTISLRNSVIREVRERGCTCKVDVKVTWWDDMNSFVIVKHTHDCPVELGDE